MTKTGIITNIQRFSLHDGPGIRTIVFFKGCPLSCKWCANPESLDPESALGYDFIKCIGCSACLDVCPNAALERGGEGIIIDTARCEACFSCTAVCPGHALYAEGTEYTIKQLMDEVLKDRPYFYKSGGGITLSGGEPLMQYEFAREFLRELKKAGINTIVETCGYTANFNDFIPYIDEIYFDVKHFDPAVHISGTGIDNALIVENLYAAVQKGKHVVARIPVVPDFNFERKNWDGLAGLLQDAGVKEAHLLPFHQLGSGKYKTMGLDYTYEKYRSIEKNELEEMKEFFTGRKIKTQIGG